MNKLLLAIVLIGSVFAEKIPVEITNDLYAGSKQPFEITPAGLLISPISIRNNGKTIKYLVIEVNAYNNENGILNPYDGKRKCKITGKIRPGEKIWTSVTERAQGLYNNDLEMDCATYYREEPAYLIIRAVVVQYMDGTFNKTPSDHFLFTYTLEQFEQTQRGKTALFFFFLIIIIAGIGGLGSMGV